MMDRNVWLCALLLFFNPIPGRATEDLSLFRANETVCFVGDSITHSGTYHVYLSAYYATRFPDRPVKMYNLGIGGHTAELTLVNFDWDVPPHNPSVAVIMLGMNDLGHSGFVPGKLDEFEHDMQMLIDRIRESTSAKLILMTPTPYDEHVDSGSSVNLGYNTALCDARQRVFKLAEVNQADVVDLNAPMNAVMEKKRQNEPGFTLIGNDRIHPGITGNLMIAHLFLKAQGAPAVVSDVVIDADTGTVQKSENCTVSNVSMLDGRIGFELLEKSLPLPMPENSAAQSALDLVPIESDLNQEMLRVSNLARGRYVLKIDGQEVGTYSSEQLATGINLAFNERTPQYRQAQLVLKRLIEKNSLEFKLRTEAALKVWLHQSGVPFTSGDRNYVDDRFRDEEVLSQFRPGGLMMSSSRQRYWKRYLAYKDAADTFPEMIEQHIQDIYQVNRPQPHEYSIEELK